jgi:hypothetical protein
MGKHQANRRIAPSAFLWTLTTALLLALACRCSGNEAPPAGTDETPGDSQDELPDWLTDSPWESVDPSVVTVWNEQGDRTLFMLPLPPTIDSSELSIEVVDIHVQGVPDERILMAFEIQPDVPQLEGKGRIFFSLADSTRITERTRLYYVKDDGRLELLPSQEVADGVLTAGVYHLSTIAAADLNSDQSSSTVDRASPDGTYSKGEGPNDYYGDIESDLQAAEDHLMDGDDQTAEDILDDLADQLEDDLDDIRDQEGEDYDCSKDFRAQVAVYDIGLQVGIGDETADSFQDYLAERAQRCLKGGSLKYRLDVSADGYPISMVCDTPVPFTKEEDLGLTGGGTTTCVIDDTWEVHDPAGTATVHWDGEFTVDVQLSGEVNGFMLTFDPPAWGGLYGYLVSTISAPEIGEVTLLDVTFGGATATADLTLPEIMELQVTVESEGDELPSHSLYFPMSDGESYTQFVPLEGAIGFDTWFLQIELNQ